MNMESKFEREDIEANNTIPRRDGMLELLIVHYSKYKFVSNSSQSPKTLNLSFVHLTGPLSYRFHLNML